MSAMTSKERVLAVLQGKIPDRVPTLTFGIDPIFGHLCSFEHSPAQCGRNHCLLERLGH